MVLLFSSFCILVFAYCNTLGAHKDKLACLWRVYFCMQFWKCSKLDWFSWPKPLFEVPPQLFILLLGKNYTDTTQNKAIVLQNVLLPSNLKMVFPKWSQYKLNTCHNKYHLFVDTNFLTWNISENNVSSISDAYSSMQALRIKKDKF